MGFQQHMQQQHMLADNPQYYMNYNNYPDDYGDNNFNHPSDASDPDAGNAGNAVNAGNAGIAGIAGIAGNAGSSVRLDVHVENQNHQTHFLATAHPRGESGGGIDRKEPIRCNLKPR